MAKKVQKIIKVQAVGGQAKPAPPLGPTLGQAGINIGEFINKFNSETKDRMGEVVPTIITVYEDRSFSLQYKTAPATALILKALKKDKGSGQNLTSKIGTLTKAQIKEIAEKKMVDLNANTVEGAMKIIEGSCRSMGVEVK
ncbi:MAG TPA: 50S ribosomal protein L11 [Candidatus Paceibacterota bacterium]|nr:50S ribosomal protein L11 [Candidatus Paceibacterota bacterium]HMP18943.1 50S ribosomal protein L11 [Candidatus Paceibacterota bacterium]HMP85609.1 50S ribosomal protein L11 [Candidatus Paceibacterota bacterium]